MIDFLRLLLRCLDETSESGDKKAAIRAPIRAARTHDHHLELEKQLPRAERAEGVYMSLEKTE